MIERFPLSLDSRIDRLRTLIVTSRACGCQKCLGTIFVAQAQLAALGAATV